ncbi:MAG: class I SAM-dependent methyltransferase [Methylobacteriaceae bacterium]|nr:class I SAM-dependent methyltransferase [Methylobacteriaceae bacterium]
MPLTALTKFRAVLAGRSAAHVKNATPDISSRAPRDRFTAAAAALETNARVLEIGTKQSIEGRSTHTLHMFSKVSRQNYLMADVEAGADVDVIADLHALPQDWTNRFDALVAVSVFEHLERPWIAAKEVARVLAPGGWCYVATHQTFPLHGYPQDFFRFSKEALALIFRDAGMHVAECAYEQRAKITAPADFIAPSYQDEWNATFPSYMVVNLFAEKRT